MLVLDQKYYGLARDFILSNARVLERRLFSFHFENGPSKAVRHALLAYQNEDLGFGYGLEPDTSSPESQPLFTVMAMEMLDEAGELDSSFLQQMLSYLAKNTTEDGGILWMFLPKGDYPRAEHFENVDEKPALSTTAAFASFYLKYGIEVRWVEQAEKFVWEQFEVQKNRHIKCYFCVPRHLMFLQFASDTKRAVAHLEKMKQWILEPGVLCEDYSHLHWGLYGVPHSLCYAPAPNSLLHPIFSEARINRDLDELIRRQQEDGRWETYYGISPGTRLEWDGIHTLYVLKILQAYGRIA